MNFSKTLSLAVSFKNSKPLLAAAEPGLKLRRGGGGLDLLALLAFFPSVISSFSTQNKGGGGP